MILHGANLRDRLDIGYGVLTYLRPVIGIVSCGRTVSGYGRRYWKSGQVRVWLSNGRMIDFGPKSLESSRIVAMQFGFTLIVQGEVDGAVAHVQGQLAGASA